MSRRTAMAVLLRRGQWLLDETAFELGGGRCTPAECRETARALAELAAALEEYSRENTTPDEAAAAPLDGDAAPVEADAARLGTGTTPDDRAESRLADLPCTDRWFADPQLAAPRSTGPQASPPGQHRSTGPQTNPSAQPQSAGPRSAGSQVGAHALPESPRTQQDRGGAAC
ncbi:hypothetical protein GCM10027174_04630 [Salinifilum aidingensis]